MGSLPHLSVKKGPTRVLFPAKINDIFAKNLQENAAKTALIFEENGQIYKYTYEQIDKISTKYANTILETVRTKNLDRNSDGDFIVAVNLEPSNDLIIILLAIWKAGIAYLPLDHSFPQARIDHILAESKPVMVIFDDNKHTYQDTESVSLDNLKKYSSKQSDLELTKNRLQSDIAIILYTSGSTGVPKGVRIPHKAIQNRLQWQFKTFPYSQTERNCVFKTALTFVDSVSEIWGPLISGLALLIIGKNLTKDPERLIQVLDKYKVERLVLVPSLLRSLLMYLNMKKIRLENLKLWVCSGEILNQALAEEFYRYFPENEYRLCNFYGSTEIMGDVTYHIITGLDQLKKQDKVPIGLPVDNTMIYLLDENFRPVKAGTVGELYVAGLNLACGYVRGRDPEKFLGNPLGIDPVFSKVYRTGDFARLDDNGVVFYEGRTDSQVKIRGNRVDLSEVEKVLNNLPGVDKGIVLCYKPGEINQTLLAFVTTLALVSENQLENLLKNQLTSYMVPQVVLIENVPLLVNGKIDRQALLRMYENTNNNDDDYFQADIDYTGVLSSRMKAATILFETIAAVLDRSARSTISVDANFYAIGGNSLNSILTITKLNESGYHINIGDFIGAVDLGEILERMTDEGTTNKINTKPPSYKTELLHPDHKMAVLQIITSSFYQKADLEQWLMPDISESDYTELIEKIWQPLIEKNLSFVTKTESNKIVAVSLNFDANDEPEVEITSKLTVIFEFLESIEGPIRNTKLPNGKGKILHSFMMGTHPSLTPKENVAVMQFMEEEVLKFAKIRKFHGIFTTNTSPLTQQLGGDVYDYKTMLDCQVNQYVAKDGTKPFGLAPDSQRAIVHWKSIV